MLLVESLLAMLLVFAIFHLAYHGIAHLRRNDRILGWKNAIRQMVVRTFDLLL
jgi:hypothetical protein